MKFQITYSTQGLTKNHSYYTTSQTTSDGFSHLHKDYWEIIYQIKGQTNNIVNDETFTLHPGDILIMPPQTVHLISFHNDSLERDVYCTNEKMQNIFSFFNTTAQPLFPISKPIKLSLLPNELNYLEEIFLEFHFFNSRTEKLESLHTIAITYILGNYIKQQLNSTYNAPAWIKDILIQSSSANLDLATLNISKIVDSTNYSYGHIAREFRKFTGMTLKSYITQIKLKKAAELLKTTNNSINEISTSLGFDSSTGFIKAFKLFFNETPLQYRLKFLNHTIVN